MLNYGRHLTTEAPEAVDAKGYAVWRCAKGHLTEVWLRFTGDACYGGSAWDFCDWCGAGPSDADSTRMSVEIFGGWLRSGLIETGTYAELCHNAVTKYPHLDRARLDELGRMANRGELDKENLDSRDRELTMRTMIGIL